MLPRENRVTAPAEFQRIFKTGTRKHYSDFTVVVVANGLNHSRFGFIASKKVGNSVVRHRAVRVLREAVRDLTSVAGVDVVIVVKPSFEGSADSAVTENVRRVMQRVR